MFAFIFALFLCSSALTLHAAIEFPVAHVHTLQWNNNGTRLAMCADTALWVSNASEVSRVPVPYKKPFTAISWQPSNHAIAAGDSGGTIAVYYFTLKTLVSWNRTYGAVVAAVWHNDSALVAAYADGSVRMYSLKSGKVIEKLLLSPSQQSISLLSTSGNSIFFAQENNYIEYNTATKTKQVLLSAKQRITARHAFQNGNVQCTVYGFSDGSALIQRNGSEHTVSAASTPPVLSISSSYDGSELYIASACAVSFWNSETVLINDTWLLPAALCAVALHPNMNRHAALSDGYKVILYDLTFVTDVSDNRTALNSIQIVPNPVTDRLCAHVRMEHPGAIHLVLVDALGRKLRTLYSGIQSSAHEQYTFSLSDTKPGMYYLVLTTAQNSTTVPCSIVR